MESKRILLIDDSIEIGELIKRGLRAYQVDQALSVEEAQSSLRRSSYDLLLIDVTLPDGNGFDLCSNLCSSPAHRLVPKIILTGKDEVSEKVYGFSCGADDYVTKPFHTMELKARVDRQLARSTPVTESLLRVDGLELDVEFQKCWVDRAEVHLTQTEFRLLLALVKNPDRVLSRQQLEQAAWQVFGVRIERRGIDTHIAHLRKKLGPMRDCITSVYGQGYAFKTGKARMSDAA